MYIRNKKLAFILLVIILFIITAVYFKFFDSDKFFKFKKQTEQQVSLSSDSEEDKLRKRYEEIATLGDSREDNEKFYDLYFSPESKQRITRDQFVKNKEIAAQSLKKKITRTFYEINSIAIKGDTGYIDRTMTLCFDQECNDKLDGRGYKKYIKINGDWFAVMDNSSVYCIREEAYEMPEEFKRVLSLITQRYGQHGDVEMASNLENVHNCLKIEYPESSEEVGGAEGVFLFSPSKSLDEYVIKVSPKYSYKDDLLTAVLLSHELTHVFQYVKNKDINSSGGCFESEAEAFTAEANFILNMLNSEEQKSLESRILTKTPEVIGIYTTLMTIPIYKGETYREKALNFVKDSSYYQEQCKRN